MDKPLLLPISEITDENPHVKTFWFEYDLQSKPGQFVMLWLPGVDQKPISVAYDDGERFGLTIFAVGNMTKKLFDLKPGDRLGITGPYGNPFSIQENTHYIMVAGGYGAGPLGVLTERLTDKNCTVDFCVGARNKDLLLFEDRMAKLPYVTVHVSTDDGSKGHQGYVTHLLETLLTSDNHVCTDTTPVKTGQCPVSTSADQHTLIATCGPEPMEVAVLNLANKYNVDCEISVERYMKCGFNICGQCVIDDLGIPMCSVGPVVNRDIANKMKEFGKYHRDKAGRKIMY